MPTTSLAAAVAALPEDVRDDLRTVVAIPAVAGVDVLVTGAFDGAFADVRSGDATSLRCACPITAVLLLRTALPAGLDLADSGRVAALVTGWVAAQPARAARAI